MSIDELIAELELRGVPYEDCTNKSTLVQRLVESRAKGIADPSTVDKFIAADMDAAFSKTEAIDDSEFVEQVTDASGNLPGGLSPEVVKVSSFLDVISFISLEYTD
jgi:hypothetical protein